MTRKPRSRDLEWGDELPYVAANTASFSPYPDHLLTDADVERWRAEMREREQKRIVPGFYEGIEHKKSGSRTSAELPQRRRRQR